MIEKYCHESSEKVCDNLKGSGVGKHWVSLKSTQNVLLFA
jgi:hypothetical protein